MQPDCDPLPVIELKDYEISPLLPGAYYISNWLSPEEVNSCVSSARDLKFISSMKGITGARGPELSYFQPASARLPNFVRNILIQGTQQGIVQGRLSQVTINHYTDVSKHIVPHKDGAGLQVIIVSFGPSHTVLNFYDHPEDVAFLARTCIYDTDTDDKAVCSVWMEPGSCLILRGDSYKRFAHGITAHVQDQIRSSDSISPTTLPNTGTRILSNAHLVRSSHDFEDNKIVARGERFSMAAWSQDAII